MLTSALHASGCLTGYSVEVLGEGEVLRGVLSGRGFYCKVGGLSGEVGFGELEEVSLEGATLNPVDINDLFQEKTLLEGGMYKTFCLCGGDDDDEGTFGREEREGFGYEGREIKLEFLSGEYIFL